MIKYDKSGFGYTNYESNFHRIGMFAYKIRETKGTIGDYYSNGKQWAFNGKAHKLNGCYYSYYKVYCIYDKGIKINIGTLVI